MSFKEKDHLNTYDLLKFFLKNDKSKQHPFFYVVEKNKKDDFINNFKKLDEENKIVFCVEVNTDQIEGLGSWKIDSLFTNLFDATEFINKYDISTSKLEWRFYISTSNTPVVYLRFGFFYRLSVFGLDYGKLW